MLVVIMIAIGTEMVFVFRYFSNKYNGRLPPLVAVPLDLLLSLQLQK
jgi:hypothetical protein